MLTLDQEGLLFRVDCVRLMRIGRMEAQHAITVMYGTNSRFLGLVSVWAARSFDQTALRPSVIKRIRQKLTLNT